MKDQAGERIGEQMLISTGQNQIVEEQKRENRGSGFEAMIREEEEEKSKSMLTEVEEYPYRSELPVLRDPNDRPGIWKIIKSAVGKDITKFCVPVYLNEPISMI